MTPPPAARHVTLYELKWSARKFKPDSWMNKDAGRMMHNVGYTTLGALQWAAWECIFMHIYASGKMPYIKARPPAPARAFFFI
jgi:hypothetical protein